VGKVMPVNARSSTVTARAALRIGDLMLVAHDGDSRSPEEWLHTMHSNATRSSATPSNAMRMNVTRRNVTIVGRGLSSGVSQPEARALPTNHWHHHRPNSLYGAGMATVY
jgi:hypothetical protein